ncbi:hypothetical protein S7335_1241 [Synechococcus sp. PCC 7335]|nr:hypothetical protein S7335_1241 [Synechococcus sp. PCC 7335]
MIKVSVMRCSKSANQSEENKVMRFPFSFRKLSTKEREYRKKVYQHRRLQTKKLHYELSYKPTPSIDCELHEIEEWLHKYHADLHAIELQEQTEFEAALAELDAEIPRQ